MPVVDLNPVLAELIAVLVVVLRVPVFEDLLKLLLDYVVLERELDRLLALLLAVAGRAGETVVLEKRVRKVEVVGTEAALLLVVLAEHVLGRCSLLYFASGRRLRAGNDISGDSVSGCHHGVLFKLALKVLLERIHDVIYLLQAFSIRQKQP